jgi:hypothetical protein
MLRSALRNIILRGPGGAGPQASQFLQRLPNALDAKHLNAYVTLINGLAADGIWPLLDGLWIFATQKRRHVQSEPDRIIPADGPVHYWRRGFFRGGPRLDDDHDRRARDGDSRAGHRLEVHPEQRLDGMLYSVK